MLWEFFKIYSAIEIQLQGNVKYVKKKDLLAIYQNVIYVIKQFAISAKKKLMVKRSAKNAKRNMSDIELI